MKEEACSQFTFMNVVTNGAQQVVVKPHLSPGKPKLEMCVSIPTMESRFKIEKESPKKATFGKFGSNSLTRSDNKREPRQRRFDSESESVGSCSVDLDSQVCSSQLETIIL